MQRRPEMDCRHCSTALVHTFLDLGSAPPSNAYLDAAGLRAPESHYPLKLLVCGNCWLVQTEDYAGAEELFAPDYAYFSSTSTSWLAHARRYCEAIIPRLGLSRDSLVVEIASNDGYLLRNFIAAGIPCLGIEPTASTAAAAEQLGVRVLREFFGKTLASNMVAEGRNADLIVGNNVYAHVPDINDFTAGMKTLLKPAGTITLEFPHLMRLIEDVQFDTVYHEHFSYLSLQTVQRIFRCAGLEVFDVEQIPTHGGSLRVYGSHAGSRPVESSVAALVAEENRRGLDTIAPYTCFQSKAERIKDDLLLFLIGEKRAGRKIAAYGAAAKGNTLLNYAGVRSDLLPFVCDAAPSKQGRFLPGSHIPVVKPAALVDYAPDTVLVLPWNLIDEVTSLLRPKLPPSTRFVTAVPRLEQQ